MPFNSIGEVIFDKSNANDEFGRLNMKVLWDILDFTMQQRQVRWNAVGRMFNLPIAYTWLD